MKPRSFACLISAGCLFVSGSALAQQRVRPASTARSRATVGAPTADRGLVRGGISGELGLMIGIFNGTTPVGFSGGLSGRIGYQFSNVVSVYYQPGIKIAGLGDGLFVFGPQGVLVEFSYGNAGYGAVGLEAVPFSLTAQTSAGVRTGIGFLGGLAFRAGGIIGSVDRVSSRRRGVSIGLDSHAWFGGIMLIALALQVGYEWY